MRIVADQRLILGPPGCGKTTRSLNIVEQELAAGIAPNRIAYVSFTKKAVEEAIGRATDRFGYKREDFHFFRTLHSLCYSLLRLRRTDVMSRQNFIELGEMLGYNFSAKEPSVEDGLPAEGGMGDRLLFIDSLARNRRVTLEDQWHEINDPDIGIFELRRLRDSLMQYKGFHALFDYTDMLEQVVKEQRQVKVDVVVIDEAQDLSRLQWDVCWVLFRDAKRVYIAGDDDQAVYRWAGADVEQFLQLEGQREVLGQSYRLPRSVHTLAQRVISRVKHRFEKTWTARDEVGQVEYLPHIDAAEFAMEGTSLILARNGYLLNEVETLLRKSGRLYLTRYGKSSVSEEHYIAIRSWERLRKGAAIAGYEAEAVYAQLRSGSGVARGVKGTITFDPEQQYTTQTLREQHGLKATGIWHDALEGIALDTREYYLTAMRSGAKLHATPNIRISTIHGAKGGEADNVVLLTDMARRTYQHYQQEPDDENRVFYVGMTRAKQRLTLVDARNDAGFQV